MFVKYPRTYNMATWLGSMTLRVSSSVFRESPTVLRAFERVNKTLTVLGEWHQGSAKSNDDASRLAREIPGERATFLRAALEIADRGFDAVIFGHTHHAGQVALPNGATYYNTGLWHTDPHFVEVDHGRVTLHPVSAIPTSARSAVGDAGVTRGVYRDDEEPHTSTIPRDHRSVHRGRRHAMQSHTRAG
jgi:hypothetical protein